MISADLFVSRIGDVLQLEVRRPPHNFFDRDMIAQLAAAALDGADSGARAIVLCSQGKNFCAGANFGTGPMKDDSAKAAREIYTEAIRLYEVPIPVIAAVQGAAVGGGLGLACAADFRVAAPTSRFHANFATLGFHQGFGLSVSLPGIVGAQRAAEMLYTGQPLDGLQAHAIGLVDQLAPEKSLRDRALEMAQAIAASAPLAVRSIKQTLRKGLVADVRQVLERELTEQQWLWQTEDSAAGIAASLAREVPRFTGR